MARFSPDSVESPMNLPGQRHDEAYYRSLRWRLRTGLLLASLLPLVLLSVYFHYQYTSTQTEAVHTHLKSVAENQRNTVDLYLRERLANLRGTFRKVASQVNGGVPRLDPALAQLRQESAAFVDLGLFDPKGKLVSYAGEFAHLVGKDYSGEPWWRQLVRGPAESVISDVYLGFRQRPHFIVALRRQVQGAIWVLRASVDPERFNQFVRRPHLAPESEAFLVNPRGRRQTFAGAGAPPAASAPPPRSSQDIVVRQVAVGGTEYIVAYAWLAEHEWALAVRVPREKAYGALTRTRWILVSFTAAFLALIVMAVFFFSNRLVRRLSLADRAQETLRQELFHAAKLASVGEMAAGVAHEINNPLAIIYEEAGMLKDVLDPELGQGFVEAEFRERLAAITEAALRGRDITRKLLAFSRQYEPEPELRDLSPLVRGVVAARERTFALNEIAVETHLAPDLPKVLIKQNQLEQVILNLINNARDAIGRGGKIVVSTAREGDWVVCRVKDTGRGISETQMPQIFFPFYTTKGVGKGTGLGLSISYGIVRSFDGRIEVESEEGKGATFSIYLPVPRGEVVAPTAAATAARGVA